MHELKIIEKIQSGERQLFTQLYEKYIDKLYIFAYGKLSNREVAEDIVSESFLSAFDHIDNFSTEKSSSFQAWLYKITYNKIVDFYKINARTTSICEYIDLRSDENIEENIQKRESLGKVKQFLQTIPSDQREILILRIWNDLSYREVAEITGKSVDNCKKIVSRTLKKIQANIVYIFLLFIIF